MSRQKEKPSAFDAYADQYSELIRDPIRDQFASDSRFFFERKIEIIRSFFHRAGVPTEQLDWPDIGCGQGDLLRLGRRHFKSAAGCDPSKGMLDYCRDLDVRLQLSLDSLPFENGAFDFIPAVCVYHHVPPERRVAITAEAVRVLKPNGKFCIIEHNPLNPVTRVIVSRAPVDADARLLSSKQARFLLTSSGCEILETRFFLLFPERLHQFTRPFEDSLYRLPLGGQFAVFARSAV